MENINVADVNAALYNGRLVQIMFPQILDGLQWHVVEFMFLAGWTVELQWVDASDDYFID